MNTSSYKLKNGTVVDVNDLSNLKADEIKELFDTPLNMYEGLQIKNDLAEIKTSLNKTLTSFSSHSTNCPLNSEAVKDIVDTRMKTNLKETILTSGNIAKAISSVFVLFAFFGAIIFLIVGELK